MPVPETFCVYDTIHHHHLTILVDGSSTHNFVQSHVAKFLALPSTSIDPFSIMVGDGGVMQCTRRYPQVSIEIQGHRFITDLFGLALSRADIVLGVQWLKELGPITSDYTSFSMFFTHMGLPVHIVADIPTKPPSASAHQLKRMLRTQAVSALFHLRTTPSPSSLTTSPTLISDDRPPPTTLSSLLDKFQHILREPTQLPPVRPISHHIHLSPNSKPIIVKPYRYPHSQKTELEKQVQSMLDSGLIRLPSEKL